MGYLFRQTWLWLLLSFLLGSLLTWLIMRATRRPKVEVSEERIQGPGIAHRPTAETMSAADTSGQSWSDVDTTRSAATDVNARPAATGAAAAGAAAAGAAATGRPMSQDKASTGGSAMRMVEPGPYPGSARPNADGSPPSSEYTVKGNMSSMLYHTTDSPSYRDTRAEIWFRTPSEAERAGFVAWNRNPKQARR